MTLVVFTVHSPLASEVDDKNWGTHEAPYQLNEYSRDGSSIVIERNLSNVNQVNICNDPDVTCINANFDTGSADFDCTATTVNGGWGTPAFSGQCWSSLEACYYFGTPSQVCVPVDGNVSNPANHSIAVSSQCLTPDPKGLCFFENDGAAKIRSNTGDDMFAITHGASAYIEYPAIGVIGSQGRLTYMERNGGDVTRDLMIPSGPSGTYADYKRFMSSGPPFVTSEAGCYQLDVNLCQGNFVATPPPVTGVCGGANGNSYATAAAVETAGLCGAGNSNPVSLTDPGPWGWTCEGLNGGADSPPCSAAQLTCSYGLEDELYAWDGFVTPNACQFESACDLGYHMNNIYGGYPPDCATADPYTDPACTTGQSFIGNCAPPTGPSYCAVMGKISTCP